MAVTLTEKAAQHVAQFIAKRGKGVGVRLGVKTTGCSGLAYKLEFVDQAAAEDLAFRVTGSRSWLIQRACRISMARSWITHARD